MKVAKKNRKKERALNFSLYGDPTDTIRTWAIISSENPLGAKSASEKEFHQMYSKYLNNPREYNNSASKRSKAELVDRMIKNGDEFMRYGAFTHVPLMEQYDSAEKIHLIFNLTLQDAKCCARDYGQESFFFGVVYPDHADISYYKTYNCCITYKLVETSRNVTNEKEADDYYSKYQKTKFKINMKAFESLIPKVTDKRAFNRSFNEHHTFMSRAMERKQSRGWLDNLPKYTEWENENNKK